MSIYDPGSAVPQWFPPPCGVVGCFPPPCGVVWSGGGSAWGGFPPPRLWHGVGSGCLAVVPPCVFGSAWGVWYTHPYDDNDDDDGDDVVVVLSVLMSLRFSLSGCAGPPGRHPAPNGAS